MKKHLRGPHGVFPVASRKKKGGPTMVTRLVFPGAVTITAAAPHSCAAFAQVRHLYFEERADFI